jgi:hypothetical protein
MQGQPFPVTKSRAEKKQRAPKLDFTQRKQLFEARQ